MISLLQSLSLKLFFNSLVHEQNIFGSSSKVFGNLWKSLGIFGNLWKFWKMFGNVRLTFGQVFVKLRKSLENRRKRRHQDVYIIKRTLHV